MRTKCGFKEQTEATTIIKLKKKKKRKNIKSKETLHRRKEEGRKKV